MSNLVARYSLFVVLLAIASLAFLHSLLSPSPWVIAGQVAGVGLAVWARRSFARGAFRITATPAGPAIMRHGPYRFVRHPQYAGATLVVWSSVLGHWSWVNAAIGTVVLAVVVARIVVEERLLRQRFPDYVAYARSTKRLVPFLV